MNLPHRNLLGEETSPYLLQHKDNPVHWRAWSSGALEEAASLQKPILLSVGYAACHWCHVMAHECFEDDEVAEVMNRLFVNIKVDREERPDIDQVYMTALTAMGEQGGWPLTMFLTPDAKPFWGGTFFPKVPRFGRPGFIDVMKAVHGAWQEKRTQIQDSAQALAAHVQSHLAPAISEGAVGDPPLGELAEKIGALFDPVSGGLRGAPKFPNAPFLDVLWLDWLENRSVPHRDAVLRTLRFMLSGGIYDHVGGGLARYSTDATWLVPHFEKMLYDNAQLIRLICFAYAETREDIFRDRIEETIAWLIREMRVEGGGFASSLDADSEGEEGKFYVWSQTQIEGILGPDAQTFFQTFELANPDGWEGDPILHRLNHRASLQASQEQQLRRMLDRLREVREKRPRPGRDDKVLVDWNGMAIAALSLAGRQFGRSDWIQAAKEAFNFVCESKQGDRLPHSVRGEKSLFPGLASDYAAMIAAAVSLYSATQEDAYLQQGLRWAKCLEQWHSDEHGSGYYLTASDSADVPMRIRGDVDEAVPSANAQVIAALVQLSTASGDHALYEKAASAADSALRRAQGQAYGQVGIIHAAALARKPMKLLINDDDTCSLFVPVANRSPDPRRVDIVVPEERGPAEEQVGVNIDRSEPGAWLCIGQSCLPPIRDPRALDAELRRASTRS